MSLLKRRFTFGLLSVVGLLLAGGAAFASLQ